MTRLRLVRLEDGNGREWWQIACRQPWWWPVPPFWKYVQRIRVTEWGISAEPAEWTTRQEAVEAARAVRDRLRSGDVRVVGREVLW
jgi:hypothetical protein